MPRDFEGLGQSLRPVEKHEILRITGVRTQSGYLARCLIPAWDPKDQRLVCVPIGAKVFVLTEWNGAYTAFYDESSTSRFYPFTEGLVFEDRGFISLQELDVDTRLLVHA